MQRTMLKSKLHRVTCTASELHNEGSCAIDQELLVAADIREFERIEVCNINNGERFSTCAIAAQRGSGTIAVNGGAAHKASRGDLLSIAAYATYAEPEIAKHQPDLVYVDANNVLKERRGDIPFQKAA